MSDYARDTQHLSMTEHGAYRLLLDYYYEKKTPLPANEIALYRICRAFTPDEQAAVKAVLIQFFNNESDGWHQKRADIEIQKAKEISAVRSRAAKQKTNGRTESTHSEGTAENEKVAGERIVAANGQQTSGKSSANKPANGQHLHTQDHNSQDHKITSHNSQVTDHKKKAAETRADKPRAGSRGTNCDDDFIAELQTSEAYKMLNVRLTYNRMLIWCQRNKKQATRNRLIGWLNREDLPMGNGNGSYQNSNGLQSSARSGYEFKPKSVIR